MLKDLRQLIKVTRFLFLFNALLVLVFCFQKSLAQAKPVNLVKAKVDTTYYYYEDGKIKSKGIEVKGKKSGMWTFYYPNGNVELKENYINNVQNGSFVTYYENGNIYQKGTLKNNLVNGPCLEYFESGKLEFKSNYLNDEYHGLILEYHESGKLYASVNYIKGKKHGGYLSYHENGALSSKGSFNNDERVGVWYEYDEKGKLTSKENYGSPVPVTVYSYTGNYYGMNNQIQLIVLPNGNWMFDGLRGNTLTGYYTKSISGSSFTLNLYRSSSSRESLVYGGNGGFLMFSISGTSKSNEIQLTIESQQSSNSMLPYSQSSYWLSK